jgi:putative FmdB family regulatory protein
VVILPVYEYRCPKGHLSEEIRPMKDSNSDTICEVCGEISKRIMSHTNVNGALGVYWPNKGIAQERVIENLGHRPVHVKSSDHLKQILKATNTREAG